jgi:RHS repeat-associated protein
VKSATGTLKGAAYPYLRHAGYDQFGQRVRLVLGNGAETRHTYDPVSRFLAGLRTSVNGSDVESFTYAYDATGTMTALQNNQKVPAAGSYGGAVTQSFSYDAFVQLTHATGSYTTAPNAVSKYSLDLTYDTLGNLTSKNQLHQTGPGGKQTEKKTTYNVAYAYPAAGAQPHAATRIGDRTFHYDANGNQTGWETDGNGTRRTLAWDEENRLASVSDNGKTTSFLYDAGGTRTNKAGQNGETLYLNPWFSLRNGAIASKHVFVDGERLATKVSPDPTPPSEKVYYYHPDHLGSANFVTDEAGTSFEHLEYFPTGEIWVDEHSDTQRTPYLFSGKELDDETGLSYFGARYYDARQGQWISADPILDEMLEVGKLTRDALEPEPFFLPGYVYGYVANSPTNLTDPNGLARSKTTRQQAKKQRRSASKIDSINIVSPEMKRTRRGVARFLAGDGTKYGKGAFIVYSGIVTRNINRRFKKAEREGVNRLGDTYGCQTCGVKESGWADGHFTPDHQQPLSIFIEEKGTLVGYRGELYPHCKRCSSKQGGELAKRKAGH